MEILVGDDTNPLSNILSIINPHNTDSVPLALTKMDLTSGILARNSHEEDRFTVHSVSATDDSYVVSVCREVCNSNIKEAPVCKDFAVDTIDETDNNI